MLALHVLLASMTLISGDGLVIIQTIKRVGFLNPLFDILNINIVIIVKAKG